MATIIRDNNLIKVADSIKPDAKKRVVLPKSLVSEGITYHIYINSNKQILLDPQVTIPASELWLFRDKKALEMVEVGMSQKESIDLGSFAQYVEDET
ncbi:hypothetical protein ACFLYS_02030 [Chloroflexota bacterium]